MIVLDGATSQPKRSDGGSAAIGAGRRVARGDAHDRVEVRRAPPRGRAPGASAARRALVERDARAEEVALAAEEHDAGVDPLAALDTRARRARSRRRTGYAPARACSASSRTRAARRAAARGTRRSVSACAPASQSCGTSATTASSSAPVDRAAQPRIGGDDRAGDGSSTCSAICGNGRAACSARTQPARAGGRARRRGRSATAGRARAAGSGCARVRSTLVDERVEPDDVGGELRVGLPRRRRASTASAPGRKSTPRFAPRCADDQLLDLRVGLGRAAAPASISTSTSSGTEQAERARQLADDHLGHERQRALPGAAELRT